MTRRRVPAPRTAARRGPRAAAGPVSTTSDRLIDRLLPEGTEDDVALVAVCLRPRAS
ncbi:hypothetical protein ABC795_05030 [Blastococcus sp. HT6-30]|uniref:hypothetical protein n=1 Tax=Blastococcus sp. HT6-30 TaxID=3144843 RepID=UPI003219626B